LALALTLDVGTRHANRVVAIAGVLFVLVATALAIAMIVSAGSQKPSRTGLKRVKPLNSLAQLLRRADRRLVRNPANVGFATALQFTVIVLDTTTMLVVVKALGIDLPPVAVFVSFIVSSLFRTLGVLPGGLGSFEASSALTLRSAGADLPTAVSATLLFRALSFWLPMAPGFWVAHRLMRRRPPAPRGRSTEVDDARARDAEASARGRA
jgi:Mg2+-importing ATPase